MVVVFVWWVVILFGCFLVLVNGMKVGFVCVEMFGAKGLCVCVSLRVILFRISWFVRIVLYLRSLWVVDAGLCCFVVWFAFWVWFDV